MRLSEISLCSTFLFRVIPGFFSGFFGERRGRSLETGVLGRCFENCSGRDVFFHMG